LWDESRPHVVACREIQSQTDGKKRRGLAAASARDGTDDACNDAMTTPP
jgi:hypothetical protein